MNRRTVNAQLREQRARQPEIAAALAAAVKRAAAAQQQIVAARLDTIGAGVAGDAPLTPGGPPATNVPAPAPVLSASEVFMDGFDDRLRDEVDPVLDDHAVIIAGALGATAAAAVLIDRRVTAQKDRLDYVSERVYDQVAGSLTDASASGATFTDMAEQVLDVFTSLDSTADAVGVTEAGALVEGIGYSTAEAAAAEQGWTKLWQTEQDDRVRPSHIDAEENGAIAADEAFDVGGFPMMFPKDPEGPIEETARCRCILIWEGGEGAAPDIGQDEGDEG